MSGQGARSGRRVLISGMGGELGSSVAAALEEQPWVGDLLGIDVDPPRRRLRRAAFQRVEPAQRERIVDLVTRFDPHVLVHLAVWEPDARAGARAARRLTDEATAAFLDAAAAGCRRIESLVVRSGIEIYGRGRRTPSRPDESCPIAPTSEYGRSVARIEEAAAAAGRRASIPVGVLRLAPVLGPHVPSPLGRLLRHPAVPFSALADPAFSVVDERDATAAFVAAAQHRVGATVNVVAHGETTALRAALRGHRLPVPLVGPGWAVARPISHLLGAPMPGHVLELLHRGRLADGTAAADLLRTTPVATTVQVVDRLYAWPEILRIRPRAGAVA